MSYQRNEINVSVRAAPDSLMGEEIVKKIMESLRSSGFKNVVYENIHFSEETIELKYGGAWRMAVEAAAGIVTTELKLFNYQCKLTCAWMGSDADLWILIPDKLIRMKKKRVLYFDPQLGCHMTGTEEEFKKREIELAEIGMKPKKGIIR